MSGGGGEQQESEAEKVNAQIGLQKKRFFMAELDPLNRMELADASTDQVKDTARGAAAADTMQALTSGLGYESTQQLDGAADMAKAYTGQLGQATQKASEFQNKRQAAAIGVAEGQEADNGSAMSLLANLGSSEALQKARNNQLKRSTNMAVAGKLLAAGGDKAFGGTTKNAAGETVAKDNLWTKMRDGFASAQEYNS
ncbi:MAG: hypothetical protein ACPHQD_04905 [Vibrio toranzoniae]|uniref:hypothetical protein n=1 Tax=Vibrio toranzoniae TaxID=1194427 RepID=UPI003C437809